jgi:hypothetical protein
VLAVPIDGDLMLDYDSIHFPEVQQVPDFAMAFTRMMFAHAEFEEEVRDLRAAIIRTPASNPRGFARLLHLLRRKTRDDLGTARDRPKRMAKLIRERPRWLVEDQEATTIRQILKDAIGATFSHTADGGVSM